MATLTFPSPTQLKNISDPSANTDAATKSYVDAQISGGENVGASGSNTQVQFNNANVLGASANFTFNSATSLLTITGNIVSTNANLGIALEEAITGSADVVFSNADVTLVFTNTNTAQIARNLRLVCVGVSVGSRELILGSGCQINKLYLIHLSNYTGNLVLYFIRFYLINLLLVNKIQMLFTIL